MNWIHIDTEKPQEGRDLFYFFPFLGVYRGKYVRTQYPEEFTGSEEPCYGDCFHGTKGFLTDDVTHWMYANGEEEEYLPNVPEGYILLGDGRHREYALKSETVRITKHEYEVLKESVKYLEGGHLTGLVCPDCPQFHIYWEEEDDGYKCGGCKKIYATTEVETHTYKYTSKYDRPCPHCNPHDENTTDYYLNGFLLYTEGDEPYSTEHYICEKCDSTYNIGEI
jgi:uncharacterized protein YbaR (Trm112 family)